VKASAYDIAIVGGGFSGVMTAVHLLRLCTTNSSILLIERSASLGRGLAYGTTTTEHLLNVAAKGMSAFADKPDHFLQWLQNNKAASARANDFVSRQWYGDYIEYILGEQLKQPSAASLDCKFKEVVDVDRQNGMLCLTFSDSSRCYARVVVLAVGNFPPPDPQPLRGPSTRRYVRYAWSPEALDGVADSDTVLLIGSGLTAIDQLVTLESRGFKGSYCVLSRRGLLPAAHVEGPSWPADWTRSLPSRIRPLVATIREQVRMAARENVGWRPVIDSLRPSTQRLWKNMSWVDRRRFLRHVRPFWEVHRHRLAPAVSQLVDDLQRSGRLTLHAGRILECVDVDGFAQIEYQDRATGKTRILRAARIVNCTGHETDARKIDSPVVRSLLKNKLARVDACLQGLDVTEEGAVIDAMGSPSTTLFALGPPRKALLWESTAVPEIRLQALGQAEQLALQLAQSKELDLKELGRLDENNAGTGFN
jgi:uncharacterized NAD(P)/FAD-binding protein YdhS